MNPKQVQYARVICLIVLVIVILIILWLVWHIYGERAVRHHVTHTDHSPSIVTATCLGKKGQLGNQLFQAAAAIGVAHTNKCIPILPDNIQETALGKLCELKDVKTSNLKPHITLNEKKEGFFQPIAVPDDGRTYDLQGYFQSHLYTERCTSIIRETLKPRKQLLDRAAKKVPECTKKHSIGLHVRRGDYLSSYFVDRYTHCSIKYYQDAVALLRKKHGAEAIVVVCSDDLSWCRKHLIGTIDEPIVFAETGSSIEDFCVLYHCEHAVIANSSFSWWAAYLKPDDEQIDIVFGDGERGKPKHTTTARRRKTTHSIVAPYPWYQKNGPSAHLNSDDIYCPNWIVLDAQGSKVYIPSHISTLASLAEKRLAKSSTLNSTKTITSGRQLELYGEAYVVSLEKEQERWESANSVLKRAGLVATHFTAVDKPLIANLGGREGLKKRGFIAEDDTQLDSEGTIGCGLSHMAIWAYALQRGESKVSMFEDDITSYINSSDLDGYVSKAMEHMDTDWDVLFLGKCGDRCDQYIRVADGLYRTRGPYCTHAYVISDRGMRKMLSRPLYTAVDSQLVHSINSDYMKAYALHPSVFMQDIVRWSSSLRNFKLQITNQHDCALFQ